MTSPDTARALNAVLINSPGRRFVELKEGTDVIMLEKNWMALVQEVQTFLVGVGTPH